MFAAFAVLALYTFGRAVYDIGRNDEMCIRDRGIINASKNIIHTSKTATNMVSNFQETVKIYQQGKKYYDALKSVSYTHLVRLAHNIGARGGS